MCACVCVGACAGGACVGGARAGGACAGACVCAGACLPIRYIDIILNHVME